MKSLTALISMAILAASLTLVPAASLAPGQVDFGEFSPPVSGGEFVEVNLTTSLISLASRFVEKKDADVAKLLSGLQLVHVNVVGLDDENRADICKRVKKVRKELDAKGWERIVTAQKKTQDVSVYLKTEGNDTVQGLTVVVLDQAKQAVFVNVVGNIRPEQLSMLGDKFHIDPLKKIAPDVEK